MNQPPHNASNDYEHILRVVHNAHAIWLAERHHDWAARIDPLVVYIAAMVHGIRDAKCPSPSADDDGDVSPRASKTDEEEQERQRDSIREFLDGLHCPPAVAGPASHIASFISFSLETHDPVKIQRACDAYPALRIVQDALGPMGVARMMFDAGAKVGDGKDGSILEWVRGMDERFGKYPGLMKTKTGGKIAVKRWEWMVGYREALLEQADCEDVL